MSPFKEPQPRKMAPGAEAPKVMKPNWPPYAREGGEANWAAEVKPSMKDQIEEADAMAETRAEQQRTANEYYSQTPLMVIPDHTKFMARTAALEAAVKYVGNQSIEYTAQGTVALADIFENYLKNGKPS